MRLKFHPIATERCNTALLCLVWMELNYFRCPSSSEPHHPFLSLMKSSSPVFKGNTAGGLRTPTRLKRWRFLGFERCLFQLALKKDFFFLAVQWVGGRWGVCVETLTRSTWSGRPSVCWPSRLWFPPLPVFTWNLLFSSHAQDATDARGIPTRPADREACRARSLDSLRDLHLCYVPPPSKTTDRLAFWFPPAACEMLRPRNQSEWNEGCSVFTSEAGETQNSQGHLEQSVENFACRYIVPDNWHARAAGASLSFSPRPRQHCALLKLVGSLR